MGSFIGGLDLFFKVISGNVRFSFLDDNPSIIKDMSFKAYKMMHINCILQVTRCKYSSVTLTYFSRSHALCWIFILGDNPSYIYTKPLIFPTPGRKLVIWPSLPLTNLWIWFSDMLQQISFLTKKAHLSSAFSCWAVDFQS